MARYLRTLLAVACIGLAAFAGGRSAKAGENNKRPLTIDDLWKLQRVGPPSVSPDGRWAAVEVTSYDVEENDARSQIWLLSTDGKEQKQLTRHPGRNSGPLWSPDGSLIAFTAKRGQDTQIHVISPSGGEAREVSRLPMTPSGIKWAADGKTLYCIGWTWPDTPDDAGYLKKEKALKDGKVKAHIIDGAVFRYWDKWLADGKRPTVFAVNLHDGRHRNLLQGCPLSLPLFQPSANDYDVSPDGKEICFVADATRDLGTDFNSDLFVLDLEKPGRPRNLTARNPASDTQPVYSPDGKYIAFLRQTTKFFYADRQRLVVHDRSTGQERELTANLDRSCNRPRWLADGRRICFETEDKGLVNVYFVAIDKPEPRTAATGYSESDMSVARTTRLAAFLRTSFDLPPTLFSHRPGEKAARQISFFNDALTARWKLGKVQEVYFKGADNRDVQMWVVFPPDFDPARKWPLVQFVHGGPHNGIMSEFHFRWNLQLWAAQGYVVGCVNFHGSSGFGQEFADSITGDVGAKPLADVMKATDWFVRQPWIDPNRLAAAGASYGGYMMAWLNGHTDRFKVMVCHAGVYNWHSMMASDIVRSRERSLGAPPWRDQARVDRQSPQRLSARFNTPTLISHGELDYRVPITQGMEYYNTLRQKGVPTRFIYFPDENHWIMKPQNSLLWHREVFAWLSRFIGNGSTSGPAAGG